MKTAGTIVASGVLIFVSVAAHAADQVIREYPVPPGSHPHDVAPAADGGVGTPRRVRESWATWIPRPARPATSRLARTRRRTA